MKEIIVSTLTLMIVSATVRFIMPRIQRFVKWLINFLVKRAEKKITGSQMGLAKKRYVTNRLRAFGVTTNTVVSDLIDATVEVMNNKGTNLTDEIKVGISNQIKTGIDDTNTKLSNKLK